MAITLGEPNRGDLAWVLQVHRSHYLDHEHFDERFVAAVEAVLAAFQSAPGNGFDRAWIARQDGDPAGCVFCSAESGDVARLRLFFVTDGSRGLGLGYRLLSELTSHARTHGKARIRLWTYSRHEDACRLYARNDFDLVESKATFDYGQSLTAQRWEKAL